MSKKQKRSIFRVQWLKVRKQWRLDAKHANGDYEIFEFYDKKELAVFDGRGWARECWEDYSIPAQLLIHNKNGSIGKGRNAEASYGCDSKAPG